MICQPRYYRRSVVDQKFSGLDQKYAEIEDTYTQDDIDQMLAGYSPTNHNHDGTYSPTGHTHPYSPNDHNHDSDFGVNIPVGMILYWPGPLLVLPSKWMHCKNGTYLDPGNFPELFNVLGYTFGQIGNQFALPPVDSRVILCSPNTPGTYDLGDTGGQSTVTLTPDQMPNHDHYNDDAKNRTVDSSQQYTAGAGIVWSATEFRVEASDPISEGGGQPHTNMQPYFVLYAVIKVR